MIRAPSLSDVELSVRELFDTHLRTLMKYPNAPVTTYVTFAYDDDGGICDICWSDCRFVACCRHLREIEASDVLSYRVAVSRMCSSCEHTLSLYQHNLPINNMIEQRARSIGLYMRSHMGVDCMNCGLRDDITQRYNHVDGDYAICTHCKDISRQHECIKTYMVLRCVLLSDVSMYIVMLLYEVCEVM